ncbi:MAG: hypothetical protein JWL81_3329 [Verrucomicrobiales bacterium]|nr:hypothetical protein [Verrucomicrobiales bacterium]
MNPGILLWNYVGARRGMARWHDRAHLESWQEDRVRTHLRRVLRGSGWLRERFAGRRVEDWRTVPIVGKQEAMSRFRDWNTAGISWDEAMTVALKAEATRDFSPEIRGITVGLSSGTSGSRGLFLASGPERSAWAGTVLGKVLPMREFDRTLTGRGRGFMERLVPGRHRVALFLRAGGGLYEAAGRGRVRFCWFDLMKPAAEHWRRLEAFDPTVLVAPPSLLKVLLEAGVKVRPEKIVSCAETCDALDRRELADGFGVAKVHEIYQATEGFLGATDAEGVMRLNEDAMVVEREWLDAEKTRFIPIITDFRRTTQPMIRHRLEDVLMVRNDAGEDVFTALKRIEGRCEDGLWAVGQGGRTRVFGDSVVRAVIAAADVSDFRVWQTGATTLEVAVSLPEEALESGEKAVAAALERLWTTMGGKASVRLVPMPAGEAAGVKRRRVRQLWEDAV